MGHVEEHPFGSNIDYMECLFSIMQTLYRSYIQLHLEESMLQILQEVRSRLWFLLYTTHLVMTGSMKTRDPHLIDRHLQTPREILEINEQKEHLTEKIHYFKTCCRRLGGKA